MNDKRQRSSLCLGWGCTFAGRNGGHWLVYGRDKFMQGAKGEQTTKALDEVLDD